MQDMSHVTPNSISMANKVLDAVETAERKTLAAIGGAVAGVVSKR